MVELEWIRSKLDIGKLKFEQKIMYKSYSKVFYKGEQNYKDNDV